MVYLGKEQPVVWNTKGIVDPTTLLMYLSSQKDLVNALYNDYKEAKTEMKDFTEKYGDFISPFTKDMARYGEIMGGIKGAINEAYARGIDPLRSPEGRMLITRLTLSVDPGEFNMMRANAKTGFEYLDALRDLLKNGGFNLDFENFTLLSEGLPLFNDFATKGSDGRLSSWGRSSPTEYKDLNKYTTHVFDALKDSYLRTEGPYDYYGVSEDNLRASLTPDTLGGLLNTALGRFHYNNAVNDLLSRGITNPTDAQKMQLFRENIVAANHEKVREDRRINEIWKMQQEDASRMRAARASRPGGQETQTNTVIGFTDRVKDAIKQQQSGNTTGINSSKYKINVKAIDGKSMASALRNWATKTVMPLAADQADGAKLLFYGYTERSEEAIDVLKNRKSVRFTFVPGVGLHYTPLRVYDHNGMSVRGSSKQFDDYLHKNHVYGYPVEEPISITHDALGNSNIYDANGFIQIAGNLIEGYFKERWTAKTHGRTDYDSQDYTDYKKKQMNQLGLVENVQETSKQYVESDDHRGVYLPEYTTYYTVPVSRVVRITGLGLSAIDTRVDKAVVSSTEVGSRERTYQNRDYNRRKK